MRARRTSSFWGMLYKAASMERLEGKVMDGRGGYIGLSFDLEETERQWRLLWTDSKQSSETLQWFSVPLPALSLHVWDCY